MDKHLVMKALLMAVYQRQPKSEVVVHTDQGSQYGSSDYLALMKQHNLVPSMSQRGNCHDNAVAESFFATIKKHHSNTGGVSPAKFEETYFSKLETV